MVVTIPKEKILSGKIDINSLPTISSWPRNFDCPSEPYTVKEPDGFYKLHVTANNHDRFKTTVADFFENGPFAPTIDDVNPYYPNTFGRWKAGSGPPNMHEYVALPSKTAESYFIVSFGEGKAHFPITHTPMPKYVRDVWIKNRPINERGKDESRVETLRQDIINYLRTKEGKALINHLMSLGYPPEYIDRIGIGSLPERAIYGITQDNGDVLILAAYDAQEKNARIARDFDVEEKDIKNLGIGEELVHAWKRDYAKEGPAVPIEMAAKKDQMDSLSNLAVDATTDPKRYREADRYRKLAGIKRIDWITTPERYGKNSLFYKELYSKNRAALEDLLASEAIDNGYTGKGITEYVATHLNQIAEEAEENGKPQAKSRLEKIAEKGHDSKEAPKEAEVDEAPSE